MHLYDLVSAAAGLFLHEHFLLENEISRFVPGGAVMMMRFAKSCPGCDTNSDVVMRSDHPTQTCRVGVSCLNTGVRKRNINPETK